MFVKSDLVEKFNWPEMSLREVKIPLREAETTTSNAVATLTYIFRCNLFQKLSGLMASVILIFWMIFRTYQEQYIN